MTLREVEPLDDDQWKVLVDTLNKEPTLEQRQLIKEAIEDSKKIKVIRPPDGV